MSSISSFLLAMTLHPDVQAKGQEEIDRVVGKGRLPTFEDRPSLPYVEAIYREILRLHPPLPLGKYFQTKLDISIFDRENLLGVPHRLIEDDFYHGYHIPEGSFP